MLIDYDLEAEMQTSKPLSHDHSSCVFYSTVHLMHAVLLKTKIDKNSDSRKWLCFISVMLLVN